jgi:hypothetical protein
MLAAVAVPQTAKCLDVLVEGHLHTFLYLAAR